MAVQTGSYDFKAAKEAHDAAAKTATNYIDLDPTAGIRIANANPSTATTYQHLTATDTEFVVDNVSRMLLGGEGARIGRTSQGHAVVTEDGFNYLQGDKSMFAVEAYGDEVYAIGEEYSSEVVIAAGGTASVSWSCTASEYRNRPDLVYRSDSSNLWTLVANGRTAPVADSVYFDEARASVTTDSSVYYGDFHVVNATSNQVTVVFAELFDRRSVRTRIGKEYVTGATNNESHMELDYHSLQMVDKEGNPYLYVSDLRDTSGSASITDSYIGDGSTKRFALSTPSAEVANIVVKVDSAVSSDYTYTTEDGAAIVFNEAAVPASGKTIEISYTTTAVTAKAYTFGLRDANYNIGAMSVAEGNRNSAAGFASHAEGMYGEAMSSAAHAEGIMTQALGPAAHSEGSGTVATMRADHAEGKDTKAQGGIWTPDAWGEIGTQDEIYAPAHAEGHYTESVGPGSHAEGIHSKVDGDAAHAGGYRSEADGAATFAHGVRVKAVGTGQAVFGRRNVEDTEGKYAFIIGNGEGLEGETSNALAVCWHTGDIAQWSGIDYSVPTTENYYGSTLDVYDSANERISYTQVTRTPNSVYRSFGVTNPKSGSAGTVAMYIFSHDDGTKSLTATSGATWPIANGGTGATTAAAARTNLGISTLGQTASTGAFSISSHTVQSSVSIPAYDYKVATPTITKSGYYPLGVVGTHTGTRYTPVTRAYLTEQKTGSAVLNWMVTNLHSSAHNSTNTIYVLWVKV